MKGIIQCVHIVLRDSLGSFGSLFMSAQGATELSNGDEGKVVMVEGEIQMYGARAA